MSLSHLRIIREYELNLSLEFFPAIQENSFQKIRVLEIGSGTGYQAKILQNKGYEVDAIDLALSEYSAARIYPITDYDGETIPFPNHTFDVIFSSNVLEHIPHLDTFQSEIKRVLKANGVVIHVLPTSTWRFWTIITHYPFCIKTLLNVIFRKLYKIPSAIHVPGLLKPKLTLGRMVREGLYPRRHGEKGNVFTEIFWFSQIYWSYFFEKNGWKVEKVFNNQLFYSGNPIFDKYLSLNIRKKLSHFLGSSCRIYKLRLLKG